MTDKNEWGQIAWVDLTVADAEKNRDFYAKVVGWKAAPVPMGDYDDYTMLPPGSDIPAAGICHARGINKDLPPQWMIYILVENLDTSIAACEKHGGHVIADPKDIGDDSRYCIIRDPAGAVAALYQK